MIAIVKRKKTLRVFSLKNYSLVAGESRQSVCSLSDVKRKWIQTTASLRSREVGGHLPFKIMLWCYGRPNPNAFWFIVALQIVLSSHGVERSRTPPKLEELGWKCQYNYFMGLGPFSSVKDTEYWCRSLSHRAGHGGPTAKHFSPTLKYFLCSQVFAWDQSIWSHYLIVCLASQLRNTDLKKPKLFTSDIYHCFSHCVVPRLIRPHKPP